MNTRLISRRFRMAMAIASIFILCAVPSAMADIGDIDVHGFASQGYMESSEYNYLTPSLKGSWAMSEYAVNVGSNINENLRIGIQLFARNLGDLGKNEVGVDWAFGDYRKYDWFGIRGGRVKMPYGFYNETADFDHTRTAILMPQSVYDLRMRDFSTAINGVNPYGNLDVADAGELEYSVVFGYIAHPTDGAVAKYFNDVELFSFGGMDNEYTVGGQVIWNTPLEGLRVGQSFTRYRSDLTLLLDPMIAAFMGVDPVMNFSGNTVENNTSSAEFTYKNLMLAGEYNTWTGDFGDNAFGFSMAWENFYGQGSYRVNRWFEFGSYYSVHYENKDDREGKTYTPNFNGWQKDLALSLRFDITPNMIFKLEGHRMDGIASLFQSENANAFMNPDSIEQNWYMVASKISFVF